MTHGAPRDTLDVALRIATALDAAGTPYALGGAIAYGIWAVPRATADVDINVFVGGEELKRVFSVLESLGVELNRVDAAVKSDRDGMFFARWGGIRIDVFTPSIDFSREAERTRVRREIRGQPAWFLCAESIAVFKLLFFRGKDLVDLERLVAVHSELDVARVRAHIVEMMGADDERVARWDQIVAGFRSH